jgi:ribonuclease Y
VCLAELPLCFSVPSLLAVDTGTVILAGVIAGLAGLGLGVAVVWIYFRAATTASKAEADTLLAAARKEAEAVRREAQVEIKEEKVKAREAAETEVREANRQAREQLEQLEDRVKKREEQFDRKFAQLEKKEENLERTEQRLRDTQSTADKRLNEAEEKLEEYRQALEKVSGMTRDEARQEVLQKVESEMDREVAELISRRLQRAKEDGEEEARKIIIQNIQRMASTITTENTTRTIDLPNDDLKGRIIGREGRNIRAFEVATGVDVIVDDTPGVVVISAFDCVRRETARMALEQLVSDGRIHPGRIEEVVDKAQKEMARIIAETGKNTAMELGVKLHPNLLDLLGRLKFRTSYGQSVLEHSKEVAHISGMLAADLGMDPKLARRCGLLHDVGKAIDQEHEGTHPQLGAEALKKAGEPEEVVNAAASHHGEQPMSSLYAVIVQAADAISASRPGARRESLERYLKRMERLEEIAQSFDQIDKAFAIQAGRELRVIAKADSAGEADCARIAAQIAKQIEEELTYPGEIRVCMIRETRFVEYAR